MLSVCVLLESADEALGRAGPGVPQQLSWDWALQGASRGNFWPLGWRGCQLDAKLEGSGVSCRTLPHRLLC